MDKIAQVGKNEPNDADESPWYKGIYSRIKNNLNIILLVPTMIGGLWQMVELASISPAYIRFFSITQLIPDGLLILFVITVLYISIKLGILTFKRYFVKEIDRNGQPSLWSSIALFVVMITTIWYFARELYAYPIFGKVDISLSEVFFTIVMTIFLIGLFGVSVLRLLRYIFFANQEWIWGKLDDEQFKCKVKRWINNTMPYILLFSIVFALKVLMVDLMPFWRQSRNSLMSSSSLLNSNNISHYVEENYDSSNKIEILYFNDKYIFIKIHPSKNSMKILVLKFDKLFEERFEK
jgi:hypothetical protein